MASYNVNKLVNKISCHMISWQITLQVAITTFGRGHAIGIADERCYRYGACDGQVTMAVSYTHLTLPTKA